MPRVVSTAPRRGALVSLAPQWTSAIGDHVIAAAWSPDGSMLAAASVAGPVSVFDGATGALRWTAPAHRIGTTSIGWNADGRLLASGGQDGIARIWDAATGEERAAVVCGRAWVEKVSWAPADPVLAVAAGRSLLFLDETGERLRDHADHPSTIADIAWRPGSRNLTAACYGGLHHYSLDFPERIGADEWTGSALVIAWSPDGRYIATGDQDASVHFWFARSGEDLMMSGYATKVRELSWDATSRHLATGGSDTVVLWDCSGKGPEGRRPLELKGHQHFVSALAWQHHGGVLASSGRDGRVVLWRPARDRRQLALATFAATPTVLAWSPDDRWLAIACDDGAIAVVPSI